MAQRRQREGLRYENLCAPAADCSTGLLNPVLAGSIVGFSEVEPRFYGSAALGCAQPFIVSSLVKGCTKFSFLIRSKGVHKEHASKDIDGVRASANVHDVFAGWGRADT
jgi:hypothetical protein